MQLCCSAIVQCNIARFYISGRQGILVASWFYVAPKCITVSRYGCSGCPHALARAAPSPTALRRALVNVSPEAREQFLGRSHYEVRR